MILINKSIINNKSPKKEIRVSMEDNSNITLHTGAISLGPPKSSKNDDLGQISVTGHSIGSCSGDELDTGHEEMPLIQTKFKSIFARKQTKRN